MIVRIGTGLALAGLAHLLVNRPRRPRVDPPTVAERVSVLLPARDEAHRIAPTVRSLLAQRGVPHLEVLVLDDGSTDDTAGVVRAVAADDARLRLLEGTPPPPGWLGKPHALAQLARAAVGDVLVCVDADVVLAPDALAAAVAELRDGLDLVTMWPRQLATGPARIVQPLQVWLWSVTLPLRLAERAGRPAMSAANGQFLVVDAAVLAAAGGFAAVAGAVLDDIALARAVVAAGGRAGIADGSRLAACRMYDRWAELSAGYRKSLWAAFGSRAGATAVGGVLALAYLVPPFAALRGSRVGLVGYAAGVASRIVTARRTGTPAWPDALAHPASIAAFLGLLAGSWADRRAGRLRWKGRPVP